MMETKQSKKNIELGDDTMKTLKDITKFIWNDDEYEYMDITSEEYNKGTVCKLLAPEDAIKIKDLKQSAIEWVKELEFRESYQSHTKRSGPTDLIHSIDWIKHFFNLTSEDLK